MALEKITVDICGSPVTIETDIEPIEIAAIAKYVEEKINEVKNTTADQTTTKITTLTCLNIASELFRLKANYENLSYSVSKKTDDLISLVDAGLES